MTSSIVPDDQGERNPSERGGPVAWLPRRTVDHALGRLRFLTVAHVFKLIGSYRSLSRTGVVHTVFTGDSRMCLWVLSADAEELRASLSIAGCFDRTGYRNESFCPLPSQAR